MFGSSSSNNMEQHLFQLKFTAKQLLRQSKKCQKEEKDELAKLKKAIAQSNMDGARIYAQNAIRKKNEALNYLRLSSRVEAVASKVQTAVSLKQVTKNIAGVVTQMDRAMQSMNLEQVSMVMDKFEQQFEDLDVQTQTMENAMASSTVMTTPSDQVESLIEQVAVQNGLEENLKQSAVPTGTTSTAERDQDELTQRLERLRNQS